MMLLFGLFIWICWTLFITAVLLPLQERIEMEAFMKQVKAEEEAARLEAEMLERQQQKQSSNYFWAYW